MNINFNIGFLKTVQNALMESLKKSKENLKNALDLAEEFEDKGIFISNSNKEYEEITALTNKSYEDFHKANGALKMVKLDGLVAIVTKEEEMTKGFGGFIKRVGENEAIINSLATLLDVTQNIIYYVEQLTQGKNDEPLKLFKDYKKLIEANAHSNISVNELNSQYESAIKDLFYPKFDLLDTHENEEYLNFFNNAIVYTDTQIANTNDVLNTVHQKYSLESKELLKLIQPDNLMADLSSNTLAVDEKIVALKKLVDSVSTLKVNKATFIYTHFVSAFFDIIQNVNQNEINQFKEKSYSAVEKIINSFSHEISNLMSFFKNTPINVNYQLQNIKPNYESLKEVSFFICNKISHNNDLYELKSVKSLNDLIGLNLYVNSLNSNLEIAEVQKNPEVVNHFENILIDLKEEVMLFGSKNVADNNIYEQHMKRLSQLSDKAFELSKMIKIDLLQRLTQIFSVFIKGVHQKHITDGVSEELSLYVVFLDNFVQNYLKNKANIYNIENNPELESQVSLINSRFDALLNSKELSSLDIPKLDVESKISEQEKTIQHIFEELYNDLLVVEEIMDQFFRTEGENIDDISRTIKPLINAKGVLKITQNMELSEVVSYMINVFEELNQKGVKEVEPQRIYNTANGLGGLLLYISAIKEGNKEEAKEVFASLHSLFKDLGITIEEAATITPVSKPIVSPMLKLEESIHKNQEKQELSEFHDFNDSMIELTPLLDLPEDKKETIHDSSNDIVNSEVSKEEHNDNLEVINNLTNKANVEQHLLNDKEDLAHADISTIETREGNEELVDIYLEEAKQEVFPNIENALAKIEESGYDKEQLTIIRRGYHTLKGSGRMVNLNYLGEIAWLVEQTLNAFLNEDKPVPDPVLDVVKKTKSTLKNYFEELENKHSVFVDVKPSFESIKLVNPNASLSNYIQVKESNSDKVENNSDVHTTVAEKEKELSLEDVLLPSISKEETISQTHLTTEDHSLNDLIEDIMKSNKENDEDKGHNTNIIELPNINQTNLDVEHHKEKEHLVEEKFSNSETTQEDIIDISKITLTDVDEEGHEITDSKEKEHPVNEIDISNINIEDIAPITISHHNEQAESDISNNASNFNDALPTNIEIDGETINHTVYGLFSEESEELIKKLKQSLKENHSHEFVLSEEFLRASHTLGSISRSVNLIKLADIAQGLEVIAKLSIEKNLKLNDQQIESVEEVVEELETFKNINELHEFYVVDKYQDCKDIIAKLEEELNVHEASEEKNVLPINSHEDLNLAEIEDIASIVSVSTTTENTMTISHHEQNEEIIEEKLNTHEVEQSRISDLEDQESMKGMDMEKLFEKITAHIDNSMGQLRDEVSKMNNKINSLEKSLEDVKESHENIISKIENIKQNNTLDAITDDINSTTHVTQAKEEFKEELNNLLTKQQELIIKGFNSVKKDLAHINNEVKKNTGSFLSGLFGKK